MASSLFKALHPTDARLYNAADMACYLHQPIADQEDDEATFTFRDLVLRFLQSTPAAAARVEADESGTPVRLYPFTRDEFAASPRLIVLDPRVRFGRPCLAGTNTPAEDVAERFQAGESLAALCSDMGITQEAAEEAVRYVVWLRR
jgi:uncharacterized protein (DUF433 family)